VTPESQKFLEKANKHLQNAIAMRDIHLNEDAGRTAYLAGYHAAQAFILETIGRVFKSHKGVQTEFLRLTKDNPRFLPEHRIFLSKAYNLKAIADYETGEGSEISPELAAQTIEAAKKFIAHISDFLREAK
jgi:uncharacterized protein (UPF0332 family)